MTVAVRHVSFAPAPVTAEYYPFDSPSVVGESRRHTTLRARKSCLKSSCVAGPKSLDGLPVYVRPEINDHWDQVNKVNRIRNHWRATFAGLKQDRRVGKSHREIPLRAFSPPQDEAIGISVGASEFDARIDLYPVSTHDFGNIAKNSEESAVDSPMSGGLVIERTPLLGFCDAGSTLQANTKIKLDTLRQIRSRGGFADPPRFLPLWLTIFFAVLAGVLLLTLLALHGEEESYPRFITLRLSIFALVVFLARPFVADPARRAVNAPPGMPSPV